MPQPRHFYLTTTIPYVNADPHLGHALEFVQADILARHRRLMGDEVFFNIGTDEHGLKVYRKAIEKGQETQAYVDEYARRFEEFARALNIDYTRFIRTTDPAHKAAAQEFWRRCEKNDDVYKKEYKLKYCVGCELEKTDSELMDGRCPIHPNLDIEIIEEENYFFKFKKYEKPLLDFYAANPNFVEPNFRFNEIKKFVETGLEDFSISRLKEKMPWGVPVPGDDAHVMYVWFDALVNYISTLGWPHDEKKFTDFWGTKAKPNGIQMAGKDQVRQQAAMWQAMLMSAGLPQSKQIVIHGFITSGGQKMSKSLGNVVNPIEIVREYGVDSLRHFLAEHIHPLEDSDFTIERFKEKYNSDLVDGLGNVVARVMQLAQNHLEPVGDYEWFPPNKSEYEQGFKEYRIDQSSDHLFRAIKDIDRKMEREKPFLNPDSLEAKSTLKDLVAGINYIARRLQPFMPDTSEKIIKAIKENKKPENLFPRKD